MHLGGKSTIGGFGVTVGISVGLLAADGSGEGGLKDDILAALVVLGDAET